LIGEEVMVVIQDVEVPAAAVVALAVEEVEDNGVDNLFRMIPKEEDVVGMVIGLVPRHHHKEAEEEAGGDVEAEVVEGVVVDMIMSLMMNQSYPLLDLKMLGCQ
jgi:hypothetical protein